jgi:hypothetical protein
MKETAMRAKPRQQPRVEGLESRLVLTGHAALHSAALHHLMAAALVQHTGTGHNQLAPSVLLQGTVSGTCSDLPYGVYGHSYAMNGSGQVSPLGQVGVSGTIHMSGMVPSTRDTGQLVLRSMVNAGGSITIQLTGVPGIPSNNGVTEQFRYTIVSGTGAYQGVTGTGLADLTIKASPTSEQELFTLTFH